MKKKTVFIFSPEQRALAKRRILRLVEHAFNPVGSPYMIASDSWLIFLQANQGSYRKALIFIFKAWWDHIIFSKRVIHWREQFYHLRTGRDGSELWDKITDRPLGTARIEREEIKSIIEGREPSRKLQ